MDGTTIPRRRPCSPSGTEPVSGTPDRLPRERGKGWRKGRALGERNPFHRWGLPRPMAMAMDLWNE